MNASTDPAEIAKFARMAHHWWDPEGELATLHAINPARLSYINQRAPLADKFVIDVGCGGGILAEGMASLGACVTGIDLCEPALEAARTHQQTSVKNINYIEISADKMSEKYPETFDIVTCLEMLEHTPEPASVISSCAALTKPGGHLFFSTLNRTLRAWLFAIVGAEYVLGLLPRNTHDYSRFIRPAELTGWIREAGLTTSHMTGLHYHPFSKQCTLGEDVSVNYMVHARKS